MNTYAPATGALNTHKNIWDNFLSLSLSLPSFFLPFSLSISSPTSPSPTLAPLPKRRNPIHNTGKPSLGHEAKDGKREKKTDIQREREKERDITGIRSIAHSFTECMHASSLPFLLVAATPPPTLL